jgi:hypothetical protein
MSHTSNFSTFLSFFVVFLVTHVTDPFVHQEQLSTAHQVHISPSHSARHYTLASREHNYHALRFNSRSPPASYRLSYLGRGSSGSVVAYRTPSRQLQPTHHIHTHDSQLDMASKKRATPQTEDGGPFEKRRKKSLDEL